MMKKVMTIMTASMILASMIVLPAIAAAADRAEQDHQRMGHMQQQQQPAVGSQAIQRASDLIGMDIRNQDETLKGQLKDIVLAQDMQKAEFLAVSFEQTEDRIYHLPLGKGEGDQEVAREEQSFGTQQLQVARERDVLMLQISREQLEQLQSHSQDEWKEMAKGRLVSDLMDMRVRGPEDENIGRIRDLIIDMESGEIAEASVGVGGFFGIRERLAAVEWQRLQLMPEEDYVAVDMREEQLEQQAFDREEYWQRLGFNGDDDDMQMRRHQDQDRRQDQQQREMRQPPDEPIQPNHHRQ